MLLRVQSLLLFLVPGSYLCMFINKSIFTSRNEGYFNQLFPFSVTSVSVVVAFVPKYHHKVCQCECSMFMCYVCTSVWGIACTEH